MYGTHPHWAIRVYTKKFRSIVTVTVGEGDFDDSIPKKKQKKRGLNYNFNRPNESHSKMFLNFL